MYSRVDPCLTSSLMRSSITATLFYQIMNFGHNPATALFWILTMSAVLIIGIIGLRIQALCIGSNDQEVA